METSTNGALLKAMNMLHKAMLGTLIAFAVIAFFLVYKGLFTQGLQAYDRELQLVAILFCFGGFYLGSAIFKKKMRLLREAETTVASKLIGYRRAAIIQWALLEGPAFFSLVCFLMVGNYAFLVLAAVFILFFAIIGPNKTKIMILLGLSETALD